jgi:HD-GYP domain-containing protein (c-di-GMP phosphodiesterase class II)
MKGDTMRSRIGLVGNAGHLLDALKAAAEGRDIDVRTVTGDVASDGSVVAVVAGEGGGSAALDAAEAIGARQVTLLELLAQAIEVRESGTLDCPRRMCAVAMQLADAVDLNDDERLALEKCVYVHDIGKICLSNDVLLKKSLLSHDDWVLLRDHTRIGAELVAGIPFLQDTQEVVLRHHECFDGTGYPDELEGDAIPKLGHLMKIIDVYSSMTSPRHYRKTVGSRDEALDLLREEQGKRFHPEYVQAFFDRNVGAEGVD